MEKVAKNEDKASFNRLFHVLPDINEAQEMKPFQDCLHELDNHMIV